MKKVILLAMAVSFVCFTNAQLIKRDFLSGYIVNSTLEKGAYGSTTQDAATPIMINQWNLAGKTGNNDQSGENPKVVDPLYYTGYAESGSDVAIDMLKLSTGGRTSIYSLDNASLFGEGTYYLAVMLNLTSASLTSAADFISFDGNYTGNAQRSRITAKGVDETTYVLGMGDSGVATTFGTALYYTQTYLAVIKVTIDGTGAGTSWLYINPEISATEPSTYYSTSAISGTALKSLRGLVIRQRSTIAAQIGGFRLASSWASALGISTGINDINLNNSIKISYKTIITENAGNIRIYSLAGSEVLNVATEGRLDTNLPKGMYLIKFVDKSGKTSTTKANIN
jgi:hypothetical protein